MILVIRKSVGFLLKVEGMIILGHSVSKFLGNVRLSLQNSLHKTPNLFKQLKGNVVRIDGVSFIAKIQSFLLLESSQDELLLLSITEEEIFAQEGEMQLASFVNVVENFVNESARGDLVTDD